MTIDALPLPGKYTNEKVVVSCDFAKRLDFGVNLDAGTAVVTIEVLSGTDPSPSDIKSGLPSVEGTKVKQFIIAGLTGVSYKIIMQVDTDEATPQRFIEELNLSVEAP